MPRPGRTPRESKLERDAVAWARARRIVVAKLTQVAGIPDRIFFVPGGRPLVVEFKKQKGWTAKGRAELQAYYLTKLRAEKYRVVKLDTMDEFLDVMKASGVK